jgi:hypothetical protein
MYYLILSILYALFVVRELVTGKIPARGSYTPIDVKNRPKLFWSAISVQIVAGVFFFFVIKNLLLQKH